MRQYLDQLKLILDHGKWKEQRAVTPAGKPLRTKHILGLQARYNLSAGFPLVTTKRVGFKTIAEELAWFLSGSTNNNDLKARGVSIWDEWADPESGDLGPIYGKQWRAWDAPGNKKIDQIQYILDGIRDIKADPNHKSGRRLILTSWNPADISRMKGPFACHTLAHFIVTDGELSCHMFQRSADMFLGVPFNIASYALMTHLLSHVTRLKAGEFVHTISDGHIYENHMEQVAEQIKREPRALPTLTISPEVTSIDHWNFGHLKLTGYNPMERITGEIAI